MASGATFHAKITADAREFIAQVEGAADALKALVEQSNKASRAGASGQTAKTSRAKKEQQSAQQSAMRAADELHQKNLQNIKQENEARRNFLRQFAGGDAARGARLDVTGFSREISSERELRRQYSKIQQKEEARAIRVEKQKQAAHEREIANLNRQQLDAMVTGRYALYDMANAYQQIAMHAARIVQGAGAAVATAGRFETAFTAVERAVGLDAGTQAFESMRNALVDLSREIPVTFEQISEIATLGAQMGVAAGDIQNFTRIIASFSSITGSTIDATAEAFGRLSALANVPVSEFENLASSVLVAGFNAVATEQEILSMSQSIAGAAANAGYSAQEIVGLATALSSLGIAPEQARGVILRLFGEITRAIEGGSDKLEEFAAASGMAAEEAQYLWKESPEQFFTALLGGLSTVENLTAALDALGITNTREINVLQRLSGNMDIYTQSLYEASTAYEEGTGLAEIYSATADNLETKITQLQNAFAALQDAAGAATAEAIKPVVDLLIDLATAATNFAKSNVGSAILPIIASVAGLTAAFAGIRFVGALATAQLLAMRTAILKMGQIGNGATNVFTGLANAIRGNIYITDQLSGRTQFLTRQQIEAAMAGGVLDKQVGQNILSMNRASVATRALSASLSVLGIAMGAISAIALVATLVEINKASNQVGQNVGGVEAFAQAIARDTQAAKEGADSIANFTYKVSDNTTKTNENVSASKFFVDAQGKIKQSVENTTTALIAQTGALGENFEQLLLTDILASDAFTNLADNLESQGVEINEFFEGLGISWSDFIEAASSGDDGAINLLSDALADAQENSESLSPSMRALVTDIQRVADVSGLSYNDIVAFALGAAGAANDMADTIWQTERSFGNAAAYITQDLGRIAQAIQDAVDQGTSQFKLMQALGIEIDGLSGSYSDLGEEIETTTENSNNFSRSVRTVLDYASDLRGIFDRIIGIEFGTTEAEDNIANAWEKIADRAEKAQEKIEDANNTIKELTADRAVLEYQLSVAERYGDERRAAQIRAKLGDIDAKLADEAENLADAQDEVSMTLEGQTAAARENRDAVDNLVGSYIDLIEAAVESGMQGQELEDYIESLKEEFYANGEAVGFSRDELDKYAGLFDQFKTAVKELDPRIDIQFNTNLSAVQQALNEFNAKLNATNGRIITVTTRNVEEDVNVVRTLPYALKVNGSDVRLFRLGLESGALSYADYIKMVYGITGISRAGAGGGFLLRRAAGGFVSGPGTSTSDSIPALLSNGEYVIQAKAVSSYGVDFMNALNQQRIPVASGSNAVSSATMGGSTIAYLSPEDRALLRAVVDRPVALYADNKKIAQSANAGNQALSQRGLK